MFTLMNNICIFKRENNLLQKDTNMIKLLIPSNCWEEDYIKNDLLRGLSIEPVYYNKTNFIELYNLDTSSKYICVITAEINCLWYHNLFSKINPTIIIFLGDECGNRREYIRLSKYCKLFLKQYNHDTYSDIRDISNFSNIIQIPLGYVNNYIQGKSCDISYNKLNDRSKIWSFVGSLKEDRINMLNYFIEEFGKQSVYLSENNWNINNLRVSPKELNLKYNNCVFVPIGRGNFSLDCYRIYETILAGSIPIICGEEKELRTSFSYDGDYPPFLFVSSWKEAITKCKYLLKKCPEKIKLLQEENKSWWNNKITIINKKVIDVMNTNVM